MKRRQEKIDIGGMGFIKKVSDDGNIVTYKSVDGIPSYSDILSREDSDTKKPGSFYRSALVALGLVAAIGGSYVAGRMHDSFDRPSPKAIVQQYEKNYTILAGDTLSELAEKYNVSLDELVSMNNIPNPDRIEVGYRLKLPKEQINPRVKTKERFPLDYKFMEQKMRKKLPSGAELQDLWVEGDFDKDGKTELVIFSLSPEDIAVSSVSDVVRFYKKTPNGVEQVYSEKLYDAYISTGFVHSMIPQIIDIDNGGLYELVVKGGSHGYYYTRIYNMDRNGVNVAKIESEETQFIDMNRDGSKEIISNENNSTAVYSWNGSRLVRNHNLEGKVQTASRELQSIASNSSYSTADKRSRMYDVQHTYGEALTLVAVRMFPVQDPADGKWKPFDSYMRGFVDKNSDGAFAGTPMGKDPVGVAFDLMIGKYSPNEFVADHFGDICSSGSRRYGSSGIEVVERYPGRPGQEWSKVRTPAGDNLYRDPQGGLHYSMGGDAINTSPQVISRGYSQGKEWIEYRDPITGNKWMESRPEPKPENDWRTVKTEQSRGYTTETKIYGTEQEAREIRMREGIREGNEQVMRDINNTGQAAGNALNEAGKGLGNAITNFFGGQKQGQ